MDEGLLKRLERCPSLPSPPGIVISILSLTEDPEVTAQDLADLIEKDPVLTTEVLRIVNSAMFGLRREVSSVRQAAAFLGISGVRMVAVGSSLARGLLRSAFRDFENEILWRRAAFSAALAREIATVLHLVHSEEAFVGCLLQDIGVLALRETLGDDYSRLIQSCSSDHSLLVEVEREQLGGDHVEAGVWLLRRWGLPEILPRLVRASHGNGEEDAGPEWESLTLCAALASRLGDWWTVTEPSHRPPDDLARLQQKLGLSAQELKRTQEKTAVALPEVCRLFEIRLTEEELNALETRVNQSLFNESLQTLALIREKEAAVMSLSAEVIRLRQSSQQDGLTGVFNRLFFDEMIDDSFSTVVASSLNLTVCFCDIDNFKNINDREGHLVGDETLKRVAEVTARQLRKGDFIARYGGDEFVMVLVGCTAKDAVGICGRIKRAVEGIRIPLKGKADLRIQVSMGFATQQGDTPFSRSRDLVNAADQALLKAKRLGRDRVVGFEQRAG